VRRPGRRAALLPALLLAAWTASGAAAAGEACLPMPGGGELTVAGVGRAVFASLVTDRALDAARLSGGVCLEFEGTGGVLRSGSLDIGDLGGAVTVVATDVTLELPGWHLTAGRLVADASGATLSPAVMRGQEAVARAAVLTIDLFTGGFAAEDVRLLTASVWIDAAHARFDGRRVWATDAWLTTCDCPPADADVRVEAVAVEAELTPLRIVLVGGVLVIGAWRWALPDPWTVDETSLAASTLPFTVAPDPDGVRGTVVTFREQTVSDGARLGWDAGSGAGARPPDLRVRLAAGAGGASVDLLGASDRLRVAWRVARPAAGGWSVSFGQRLEGGAWREPVRDVDLTLGWRGTPSPGSGAARVALDLGAFAAVSAQRLAGGERVGARLGASAGALLEGPEVGGVRPSVRLAAGVTLYPSGIGDGPTTQAWGSVAPTVAARWGAWRLDAAHLARWVVGASPFGTTLDRVGPAQRTDLSLSVRPPAQRGWAGVARLALRYDWLADSRRPARAVGLERLQVALEAGGPAWAGRLDLRAEAALAGWVDPRPDRPTSLAGAVAWTRGGWELGARTAFDPLADVDPWREVTVFAAVPFATGAWAWRPYLALDVAAWARGAGPRVVGHGLDLAWTSCCGVVELGYRVDGATGTRVTLGLRLEPHDLDAARLAAADASGSAWVVGAGHGNVPAMASEP